MSNIRVDNLTRNQSLIAAGDVADNHWTRLKGLLGRKSLAPGDGLLIVPSNSIHMFFMRFPIDVLYVDKSLKVVGLHHALKPWRLGQVNLRSHLVVELPAGTLATTGTQIGDQLELDGYSL